MRLLIITQIANKEDNRFGFFHDWIFEFAKQCDQVIVICLYKGVVDFPENVKVLSLGKEKGQSRIKYIFRFYKYIWQERKNYDAVFVHMNQVYVLLGGLFWKLWRKKIALWFVHKSTNLSLRIAEKIVDRIFTASKESFRLASGKTAVIGHGINTDKFNNQARRHDLAKIKLLTVSRMAPSKNINLMIKLVKDLNLETPGRFSLDIYGEPIDSGQRKYFESLQATAKDEKLEKLVFFRGGLPNEQLPHIYRQADVFLNFSDTGSIDKAVLEAMSCGTIVLTSNIAFKDMLNEINSSMYCGRDDAEEKTKNLAGLLGDENLHRAISQYVRREHSLDRLIKEMVNSY